MLKILRLFVAAAAAIIMAGVSLAPHASTDVPVRLADADWPGGG